MGRGARASTLARFGFVGAFGRTSEGLRALVNTGFFARGDGVATRTGFRFAAAGVLRRRGEVAVADFTGRLAAAVAARAGLPAARLVWRALPVGRFADFGAPALDEDELADLRAPAFGEVRFGRRALLPLGRFLAFFAMAV